MNTTSIGNSSKDDWDETIDKAFDRHEVSFKKLANTEVDPETEEVIEPTGQKPALREEKYRGGKTFVVVPMLSPSLKRLS